MKYSPFMDEKAISVFNNKKWDNLNNLLQAEGTNSCRELDGDVE